MKKVIIALLVLGAFGTSVFAGEWKKDRAIWRFEADSSLDYDFSAMKRWE